MLKPFKVWLFNRIKIKYNIFCILWCQLYNIVILVCFHGFYFYYAALGFYKVINFTKNKSIGTVNVGVTCGLGILCTQ